MLLVSLLMLVADGAALYDRMCLPCHGSEGDGAGPAAPWLHPAPRDLTAGAWKWGDVEATIRYGAGAAMPAFGAALDDAEIDALVAVVARMSGAAPRPTTIALPARPRELDAARGAALWSQTCASCHGPDGKGGGPAVVWDLTAEPLRRPHAPGGELDAIATTIVAGVAHTAMPSFDLDAADLWAVVAHVDGLRWKGPAPLRPIDLAQLPGKPPRAGYWPGDPGDPDAAPFGGAIGPQGEPPEALAPAQASLASRRCGRCHASQERQWRPSIHAAALSVGMQARLAERENDGSCLRCHAPLHEQQGPGALQDEGITCAACHVRGWTRHGPTTIADSLLPLPGYPKQPLPIYERSDFCLPCHQLPANDKTMAAGRPLLDTYREWLAGPYMRRGVQCQHCHMPNREHTFLGVHDPETFRQGIRVEAIAARGASGVVSVRARVWNDGAGHYLPTTPTPAAWLEVELVDAAGRTIRGASAQKRIGRKLRFAKGAWIEEEDTRVPPGAAIELAAGWKNGRVADATHARITVRVHPDDFYEHLYRARLEAKLPAATLGLYQAALDRALGNRYVAETILVPL